MEPSEPNDLKALAERAQTLSPACKATLTNSGSIISVIGKGASWAKINNDTHRAEMWEAQQSLQVVLGSNLFAEFMMLDTNELQSQMADKEFPASCASLIQAVEPAVSRVKQRALQCWAWVSPGTRP